MHVSPTNQHGYYTAETSAVSMVTHSEVVAGSVVADHGRIHDAFPNGFSVSDTVVRGFRPGNPSAGISEGDVLYPTSPTHWKVWWQTFMHGIGVHAVPAGWQGYNPYYSPY